MGKILLLWIWVSLPAYMALVTPPHPQSEQTDPTIARSFQFSAIRIPVWVSLQGLPVTNLKPTDFALSVDHKPVKIEQVMHTDNRPMELVYLLDLSGSMQVGGKLAGSIEAIEYFISSHRPGDRWRLFVFADGQVVKVLDQDSADQWQTLVPKLRAYGKTALYDALNLVNTYFSADSLASRAVLLFTDGHDNQSLLSEDQVIQVLKKLDVPIFIVAIADGFIPQPGSAEEPLAVGTLRHIGETTGGNLFVARDVKNLAYISRTLARKMRPQYLLTVTVERGPQDQRHQLDVYIEGKKPYQLRFRKGYTGSLPELLGGD